MVTSIDAVGKDRSITIGAKLIKGDKLGMVICPDCPEEDRRESLVENTHLGEYLGSDIANLSISLVPDGIIRSIAKNDWGYVASRAHEQNALFIGCRAAAGNIGKHQCSYGVSNLMISHSSKYPL